MNETINILWSYMIVFSGTVLCLSFKSIGSTYGDTFQCNINASLVCQTESRPVSIVIRLNKTTAAYCLNAKCFENKDILGEYTVSNDTSLGILSLHIHKDSVSDAHNIFTCDGDSTSQTVQLVVKEMTVPPATITPRDNNNTIIIIVLVSVFGGAFVIQLIVATYLHIKIYSKYTSDTGKVVGYISLSAIPFIGIFFIHRFYKWGSYQKYPITRENNSPNTNKTSGRSTIDNNANGHTNNGTSDEVEDKSNDKASYDNSTNYDNATYNDDIILDHNEHHPVNKKTNYQTMTGENSAVLSSYIDLLDVCKRYEHLHSQQKNFDYFTKRHSGNLHETGHDHGGHILDQRRKSKAVLP